MKLFWGAVLLIVTFTALFTCNKKFEKEAVKKQGGTISIGIQGSADNLFPFNLREYYAQEISDNLLSQALTHVTPDGDVYPELATTWEKGEQHIIYHLKENVEWSNGQLFSAQDVKITFDFIRQNKEKVSTLLNIDLVKDVIIVDSLIIRFEFFQSIERPHSLLRFPVLNKGQILKAGDWTNLKKNYYENFVGCGPFIIKKIIGSEINLVKNKLYHKTYPFLDTINFKFYSSTDSLQAWLKSGQIDLVPDLPHNMLKFVKNKNAYDIIFSVEPGYTFIGWNLHKTEVSDLAVRKGLSHALDRQTMVDGIMSGYATVYDSPAYPEFWAYHDAQPLKFDLEKAHAYLKKAGWVINKTSRELEKNGEVLSIKIITNRENDLRVKIALNIKAYWEAIGVKVELESVAWGEFLKKLKSRDYDAALISWVASDIFDPTELYHSSGIKSDNNFMNFASDSVDLFIEKALSLDQKSSRRENWINFQKKIIEERPVTVLFGKRLVNIVSKKLKNVRINSNGFLYNAKEFWLDDRK